MTVERQVFVGLGSNLGNRKALLAAGRQALENLGHVTACSSIYETEPWGVHGEQPRYLNQVCCIETELDPVQLVESFMEIERRLGRERHERFSSRTLDIDLLIYGQLKLDNPVVTVPHPRMCERAFVMVPLAEIAPGLEIPGKGQTAREIADLLGGSGVHRIQN